MMPNRNYNSGRAFEYRVQKYLREKGWFVLRSAGSHTVCDLLAIRKGEINLVQCKKDGRLPPAEKMQLLELANEFECRAVLAYTEKRKLVFKELAAQGGES